jgi:hypothetical protein
MCQVAARDMSTMVWVIVMSQLHEVKLFLMQMKQMLRYDRKKMPFTVTKVQWIGAWLIM